MSIKASGHLEKMHTSLAENGQVDYQLPLDDQRIGLNALIGKVVSIEHLGDIHCIHCGRRSKKSFSQGYCYPCFAKLPQCDTCIMSPEKCHFHHGTCRDPEWGEKFCFTDHFVYLANSSGVKVGITRGTQLPTRWIDQGATQGLPIFRVQTRYQAGLIEDCLREHVADKTHWQKMLKGNAEDLDLAAIRDELMAKSEEGLELLEEDMREGEGKSGDTIRQLGSQILLQQQQGKRFWRLALRPPQLWRANDEGFANRDGVQSLADFCLDATRPEHVFWP